MQQCCKINFCKCGKSPKNLTLIFVTAIMMYIQLHDLNKYEKHYGKICTVWIAPYFFNALVLMAFSLIAVALFSNAPFYDGYAVFAISKAGRGAWYAGAILYIVCAAGLWAVLICAIPFIVGVNCLDYSLKLNSAIFGNIGNLSLAEAELISFLLIWLVTLWTGLLNMFCNVVIKRGSGVAISSFLCLFAYLINIYPPFNKSMYISPVSWMNIRNLNWTGEASNYPHFWYACAFIVATGTLMMLSGWFYFSRHEIKSVKVGVI